MGLISLQKFSEKSVVRISKVKNNLSRPTLPRAASDYTIWCVMESVTTRLLVYYNMYNNVLVLVYYNNFLV